MNGGPLVRSLLTPGLTPLQSARLRDDLARLTRLPEAPAVYIDADRIAGRYMLSPHAADHPLACSTVARLLEEHHHDPLTVAWVAGMAHGVRVGRRFALRPGHRPPSAPSTAADASIEHSWMEPHI